MAAQHPVKMSPARPLRSPSRSFAAQVAQRVSARENAASGQIKRSRRATASSKRPRKAVTPLALSRHKPTFLRCFLTVGAKLPGGQANIGIKMQPANGPVTGQKRSARKGLTPRAPTARSRVSNGRDILPGVDQRRPEARRYRDITAQIVADQGGADRLSEARLQLIRRYAGKCVLAEKIEARIVSGEAVDVGEYAQLTSTLTRVASRIGIGRQAKVVPNLHDYIEGSVEGSVEEDADT